MRPLIAATPFLTVIILLLTLHFASGTLTSAKGILFDLPGPGISEGETTDLVAIVTVRSHETLVFFNDARYVFDDPASVDTFREHLSELLANRKRKTLLVLADRRVTGGILMNLASTARLGGAERILFAEKHEKDAK